MSTPRNGEPRPNANIFAIIGELLSSYGWRIFTTGVVFTVIWRKYIAHRLNAWRDNRHTLRNSGVSETLADVERFISDFEREYGGAHPLFYRGSYADALNDAKRELKFLLVYLHCDSHQYTKHFCRSVLSSPAVTDYIASNNVLFWSCSVNYSEGYRVSQSLRECSYPFLALIGLKQNRMLVIKKFEGNLTVESLLTQLSKSIDENEASLIAARLEREERNMNQLLRQQQDEAFAESLRADQEKERKKQEERSKREAEEKAKKEKQVEASKRKERLLQLKLDLVDKIPAEPEAGDPNATKIVIKLPNGTRLERRFLKTESIKLLYYYVFCHDQSPLHFQIRTNFPKRDLPGRPPSIEDFESDAVNDQQLNGNNSHRDPPTFEECSLDKGAMLFVNDLEA